MSYIRVLSVEIYFGVIVLCVIVEKCIKLTILKEENSSKSMETSVEITWFRQVDNISFPQTKLLKNKKGEEGKKAI